MAGFNVVAGGGGDKSANPTDYFPTPYPVTRALLSRERFPGRVWEPACGKGHIVRVLEESGYRVESSDLHPREECRPTFSTADGGGVDFLKVGCVPPGVSSIVTNPPFRHADEFVLNAVRLGVEKHAWLLRVQYVEGSRRFDRIFSKHPPARILAFTRRVQVSEMGLEKTTGGMIAYAWWVWERGYMGPAEMSWIDHRSY